MAAVYMADGADLSQYDKLAMLKTFVASAGSMTLYMEMLDGKTGARIVQVIDPKAASDGTWH